MEEHYIKDVGKITYVYGVNLEEHKTVIEKQQKRIAELEQELAEMTRKYEFSCRPVGGLVDTAINLEKQLAELKQKAIVPKFKIGQEIYYYHIARNKIYSGLIEDIQYFATRSGIFYRIPNLQRDYFWIREDELFATEQEAQEKLKEIQGE